jgi:hypothetical protein
MDTHTDYRVIAPEATARELAHEYGLTYDVFCRLLRARHIDASRRDGALRFYDTETQQAIIAAVRYHQQAPRMMEAAERLLQAEEHLQWMQRLADATQERDEWQRLAREALAKANALAAENAALRRTREEPSMDAPVMPELTPAQQILDEQVIYLTQVTNSMMATLTTVVEKLDDLAAKVGCHAVIVEKRLQAIENGLDLEAEGDESLTEARARGRAFLAACESDAAVTAAEHIRNQGV